MENLLSGKYKAKKPGERYYKERKDTYNLKDVVTLISCFIRTEPEFNMKNIFIFHVLHRLSMWVVAKPVWEFFVSLFDPNDFSLNLPV